MKTKNNNKGFSLVELIVVVAIMAVLVGVLAPAYLKYVEKSRFQKDVSAIGEVVNACEVALADEKVYKEVSTTDAEITLTALGNTDLATEISGSELKDEVTAVISNVALSSKTLEGTTIKITVKATGASVAITGADTDVADDVEDAVNTINGVVES